MSALESTVKAHRLSQTTLLVLLCCVLCASTGITPAHAQGTVTGATITTSVSTVTVPVGTPATFTATVSGATPNPDQYWTVISGPTYSWWGYGAHDPSTTTLSYTFSSAGTNTSNPSCVVSYVVQYARGGTATISMTATAPTAVTIYVIGGPISGTNDIHYYCDPSTTKSGDLGYLSAATGQPAGTTYSWSLSGNAQWSGTPSPPTASSATYTGKTGGSTNVGDVKATVTYSLNGVSAASPQFSITVHAPTQFIVTGSDPPIKYTSGDKAYGFDGQNLHFKVLDGLNQPVNAYWDESWEVTGNGNGPEPAHIGGPLDRTGSSIDYFSSYPNPQPTSPDGDKVIGPLTHSYLSSFMSL